MNPFAVKPTPSESEIKTAVRAAEAENVAAEAVLEAPIPEVIEPEEEDDMLESSPEDSVGDTENRITGHSKLSRLIDDDFPFDESQLDAIEGLSQEKFACLTGAAGTGKTTVTKKLVDTLLSTTQLATVNMESYWKSDYQGEAGDDYEMPESWVPSVVLCAFTGRAAQMIKKNFPRDWHGNIMTIHRMLGYMPEWYEDWDEEEECYRKKMRFAPTYNADFKMPWDIIIIDEAGMLGIDLWHEIFAAMKPGCRVIMVGDINQLPPVHGRSIFGYAMCNWPSWELTKIHRQQGVNNPIVDNAWRIIHGQLPQSEGRFQMIELKGDAAMASRKVRAIAPALQQREVYDPIRDAIITPINGNEGSRGYQLGQLPLNREFALIFNPQSEHTRFIIDGGRERKQFAVGDKVMATVNDWEAGITNGMTGVITEISPNSEYSGDTRRFGPVEEVNKYFAESAENEEYVDISLEDLDASMDAIDEGQKKTREKRERGPASHIVTVRFGDAEHGIEVPFQSLSEVGSLMTAYVVTCHKMQGGEAPTVVIICHDSHRAMLYREWLYTAVTRASEKCILLYSPTALKTALNKQKMAGRTLREKVLAFNALQEAGTFANKEVLLPHSDSTRNRILDREEDKFMTPAALTTESEKQGGVMALIRKQREESTKPKPEPEVERVKFVVETVHRTVHERVERVNITPSPDTNERRQQVDGGELTPERKSPPENRKVSAEQETPIPVEPPVPQLPPPPVVVSLPWAAQAMLDIERVREQRFLPAPPPPVESKPVVNNPFAKVPF